MPDRSPSSTLLALAYFSLQCKILSSGTSGHPAKRVSSELWSMSALFTALATGFSLTALT